MIRRKCFVAVLVLIAAVPSALAQTVTTGGGNSGTIPVFTGGATIDNSSIYQSNGNIGIGVPNPQAPLTIMGNVMIGLNYHGDASLQITGPQGCCGRLTQIEASGSNTDALNVMSSTDSSGAPHYWTWGVSQNQWTINPGLSFTHDMTTFTVNPQGHVGIGTFSPAAALEVHNGNVLLSGSGASITFSDNTVQSTAWNGTTIGGDYAESIDVSGPATDYQPGDVLTIDPAVPGKFRKSDRAYSRLVAGVFSTKPGLVGRRVTVARVNEPAEVPLALTGIVPVKVSAENGPIRPGDLLVSASRNGYAMKGTDTSRITGSVIGKAMDSLPLGYGSIEVMVALQ